MIRSSNALVALLFALLLVACGGSSDGGSDTTVSPTNAPETTEAPVTQPPDDGSPRVKDGDTVRVHYTGTVEGGEQFDTSRDPGREPLEFVVGTGAVIPGFDEAVRGLAVGETRTQRIEPEDGYGLSDPALVIEVPVGDLPDGTVAGDPLFTSTGQQVTVVSIDDATGIAMVDTNFFLAGKVLIFDVELIELIPAG